jgi:hypothetical protein
MFIPLNIIHVVFQLFFISCFRAKISFAFLSACACNAFCQLLLLLPPPPPPPE